LTISSETSMEIDEIIKERIEKVYNKYLVSEEGDIDIFIDNIIKETHLEMFIGIEINDEASSNLMSRINRTKGRWAKKEVKEKVGLYEEVNIIAEGLYKTSPERFMSAYGLDNPEELKEKRIRELENWKSDRNFLLIDFPYLDTKMKYQIKIALINDCKYLYIAYMKDVSETQKKNLIAKFPKVMSNVPYDYTNRAKLTFQKIEAEDGLPDQYVNKYIIDDDHIFESLVDVKTIKNVFIGGAVGALNEVDFNTFINLLSFADESFYVTREIIVPLRKLVILNYGENNTGAKNYLAIRDSLFKMQHLTVGVVNAARRGFGLDILDNVDITEVEGREMVRVLVNEDIVRQIVENNTINMYRDVINGFKLNASRLLIMKLQMERIALSAQGMPLVSDVGMSFFRGALYFADKKKYRNIRTVENALNEIIESGITLKSFIRKGDTFRLEFYPISNREKKDLLIYPTEPKLLNSPR